jgi:hypothetical protein
LSLRYSRRTGSPRSNAAFLRTANVHYHRYQDIKVSGLRRVSIALRLLIVEAVNAAVCSVHLFMADSWGLIYCIDKLPRPLASNNESKTDPIFGIRGVTE